MTTADRSGPRTAAGGSRRRLRAALCTAVLAYGVVLAGEGAARADDLGVFSGPVRFEAPEGVALVVGDRRYVGTIEARVGRDGVTVVDELALDDYLEGLAEVPVSWPDEALRAQVVAARTYAWWEARSGAWQEEGFDLCGTQACQVFAGRDVVERDTEGRWAAAVSSTAGEVLVDDAGDPLLARYSSSNGGASVANVEAFPDDGDLPYLQSVEDPFDDVSPLHEWRVVFPRDVLDEILSRGQRLRAAVPLADIRLEEVEGGIDRVVVVGEDGTEVAVGADEFRFFVSRVAPTVAPDRYPGQRPDVDRPYPATLLSSRVRFTVTPDEVVVDGRGFGHGVGMSQYGALGRAEAGQTHEEILAAYYGGIRPSTPLDVPPTIRVGFLRDVEEVTVALPAPTPVVVGDTVITERGLGRWTVRHRPDRTVGVVAPTGFGAPLVVDPTSADRTALLPAAVVRLETVVNKPVELFVEVRGPGGAVLGERSAGVVEAGRHHVDWSPGTTLGGTDLEGELDVALVAVDEDEVRAGSPVRLLVATTGEVAQVLGTAPGPAPARLAVVPVVVAGVLGALVGASLSAIPGRTRRRPTTEHQ